MKVRIAGPAAADVEAAFQFINQRNPRAARTVRSAIRQTIRSLAQMPNRGRNSPLPGLREVAVRSTAYIVAYRVNVDDVLVLRVRHASQDPAP